MRGIRATSEDDRRAKRLNQSCYGERFRILHVEFVFLPLPVVIVCCHYRVSVLAVIAYCHCLLLLLLPIAYCKHRFCLLHVFYTQVFTHVLCAWCIHSAQE